MAIWQSKIGKRQEAVPSVYAAGEFTTQRATFTFSSTFAFATDVLELGVLPAGCRVVDAIALPESLNGNITIGLMSGTVGDPDAARTVGAELWSATAMASTPLRLALLTGWNIAPSTGHRSIGMTGSADITASASKILTLLLSYSMF